MLPTSPEVHPDNFQSALERAREHVAAGDPLTALKVLVDLLRAAGLDRQADEAVARVLQTLDTRGGPDAAGAAEELSGLLAMMSLQQNMPSQPARTSQGLWKHGEGVGVFGNTGSAAAAAARNPSAILDPGQLDQADGASFACQQCGGVVSVARQAAHQQLWCPALQDHHQQQRQQQQGQSPQQQYQQQERWLGG